MGHARLETTRAHIRPTAEDRVKAIDLLPVDRRALAAAAHLGTITDRASMSASTRRGSPACSESSRQGSSGVSSATPTPAPVEGVLANTIENAVPPARCLR